MYKTLYRGNTEKDVFFIGKQLSPEILKKLNYKYVFSYIYYGENCAVYKIQV
jgi:hypothetical protein